MNNFSHSKQATKQENKSFFRAHEPNPSSSFVAIDANSSVTIDGNIQLTPLKIKTNATTKKNTCNAHRDDPQIFLLQTHRARTWSAKTYSYKHVLHRNLTFGDYVSKETSFYGSSRFRNGLGWKIQAIRSSKLHGTKTLDSKRPLIVMQPKNLIIIVM